MVMVLIAVMTIALSFTGWITYQQQEQDIVTETNLRGDDISRFLSQAVATSVIGFDYTSIQFLLEEISKTRDIVYAKVVNARGNLMAESGIPENGDHGWATFKRDINFEGKKIGEVTIALDNSRIVSQLQEKKTSMIQREAMIIVLIAIGEFLALSYLIVRPVSIIRNTFERSVDESGLIINDMQIESFDEFGALANQFNSMRGQLNTSNLLLKDRIGSADTLLRETNIQLSMQSEELHRINKELRRISVTDALTGLLNRRHFETIMGNDLALSLSRGEVSSLLIFDIDHFKRINEIGGYKGGDLVLAEVAHVLKANLRQTDTLCRIDGTEFVAICRRVGTEEAIQLAEKIRNRIQEHIFPVRNQSISVRLSVGIDTLTNNIGGTAEDIFHRADMALYYSKNNGCNTVSHYSHIKDKLRSNSDHPKGEVA